MTRNTTKPCAAIPPEVKAICKRCTWMLRWLASQPATVLKQIIQLTAEQWERLMVKWETATQLRRHRDCEKATYDAAVELQILRSYHRDQIMAERLRSEILAAVIECSTYETLYARCMEILEEEIEPK